MSLTTPPSPSWATRNLPPIESVSDKIYTSSPPLRKINRIGSTSRLLERKKKDNADENGSRRYSSASRTISVFSMSEDLTERDAGDMLDEDSDSAMDADDLNNSKVYINACKKFGIIPTTTYLKNLTTTQLILRYHSLGPQDAKAIAVALMTNLNIQTLDLKGNCIGPEGAEYIAEMLNENLYILNVNLAENNIGGCGARAIANMMRDNSVIHCLNISGNNLNESDAVHVADIIQNNRYLKELDVSYNRFSEIGGKVIGRVIGENNTLNCLSLKWNHLRRQGAVYLAQGLKSNQTLEIIDLSWNGLGMEGCRALGVALGANHTLSQIDLSSNRITDNVVKELMKGLAHNKELFTLKIGNNPITLKGTMEIITTLDVHQSGIQELDLTNLPTDSGFAAVLNKIQTKRILEVIPGVNTRRARLPSIGRKFSIFDLTDPMMVLFEYMQEKHLRLIDMFHKLDEDGSHTLTRGEFKGGLLKVNIPMSERALNRLMDQLDEDYDGEISFSELIKGHRKNSRKKNLILTQKVSRRTTLNDQQLNDLHHLTEKVRTFLKGKDTPKEKKISRAKGGRTSLEAVFQV